MGGNKKKKNNKQKSGGGGPPIAIGGVKITDKTNKKAKVVAASSKSTAGRPVKKPEGGQAAAVIEHEMVNEEVVEIVELVEQKDTPKLEALEITEAEFKDDDFRKMKPWHEQEGESYDLPLKTSNINENIATNDEQDSAWTGGTNQQNSLDNFGNWDDAFNKNNAVATEGNSSFAGEVEHKEKEFGNKGAVQKEFQHSYDYKQNRRDNQGQNRSGVYWNSSRQQPNQGRSTRWGPQDKYSQDNLHKSKGSWSQDNYNRDTGGEDDSKCQGRSSGEGKRYQSPNRNKKEGNYNKRENDPNRQRTLSPGWGRRRSPNRNDQSGFKDKEFDEFWKYLRSPEHKNYVKVREMEGDLFAMPKEYSLAHCVAEDMNMGSGIAVQFSQQFKRRDELYQQKQKQGGLAFLTEQQRYIYYLVTKKQSTGKPTMHTLWCSLQKMQKHIEKNKVSKVAIPRIGCGLDRLDWSHVKPMIEYTFQNTDVEITVCNFQQSEDAQAHSPPKSSKCSVKNVSYPLVQIEEYTAIVYLGSEDGFVTEEIESLDTKFRILQDYKTRNKKVGEVIQSFRHQNAFVLYGFIVRKSKDDPFNFVDFQKCVNSFKKMNVKNDFCSYMGMQAFLDDEDDLLMNKIVNILRYSLNKVEIYVCWPGKMAAFMPQERRNDYYY